MIPPSFRVEAADGHRIPVYALSAVDAPRAVLLVAHGMAEHGARYAPLGAFLGERGYAVYALDHRGHGAVATGDDKGHFGDEDGWQRVIADLHRVVLAVRAMHPGLPFVLLGHSMGSFISQGFALRHGEAIDALVLSGSNFGSTPLYRAGRAVARLEKLRQGAHGRSALLEFLSFGAFNKPFRPNRTGYDWLSRDNAEVDKYVHDPLCGFRVTNQLWIDLLGGLIEISARANLARIPPALPVYVFGGDRDPVGESGKGLPRLVAKLREAGLRDVSLKLYAGGRHETLNETNRAEVFADLAAWLANRVSG